MYFGLLALPDLQSMFMGQALTPGFRDKAGRLFEALRVPHDHAFHMRPYRWFVDLHCKVPTQRPSRSPCRHLSFLEFALCTSIDVPLFDMSQRST